MVIISFPTFRYLICFTLSGRKLIGPILPITISTIVSNILFFTVFSAHTVHIQVGPLCSMTKKLESAIDKERCLLYN